MNKRIYIPVAILTVALLVSGCQFQVVTGSGKIATETRQVGDFSSITLAGSGDVYVTQAEEVSVRIEAEDNLICYFETVVHGDTLTISIKPEYETISLNPTKPVKFYVTTPEIDGLTLAGSGDIIAGDIEADSFNLSLLGSGDITAEDLTISGNVDINLAGSGDIKLGKLSASEVTSSIAGSGNITVQTLAADQLSSTTAGSGNVRIGGEVTTQHVVLLGSGDYLGEGLASEMATVRVVGSGNSRLSASETLEVTILGSGDVTYSGSPRITVNVSGSGQINQAAQ